MISPGSLQTLALYHAWIGERLFDAAGRVPEVLLTSSARSHGSVLETLRHVADVAQSWRNAAEGTPEHTMQEMERLTDLASIRAFWTDEDERLIRLVSSMTPADSEREVAGPRKRSIPMWQVVFHIVNHSVEHGNEIGWALTELGQSPSDLGFMHYLDTNRDS
jgi:uncharacterized damage-inducible protein DinB